MKEILLNLLALALTALSQGGEIPAELQSEIDSLKEAIDALPAESGAAAPDQTATNELLQRMTNIAEQIKDANGKQVVSNKVTEAKVVALNAAVKAFEAKQKGLKNLQLLVFHLCKQKLFYNFFLVLLKIVFLSMKCY